MAPQPTRLASRWVTPIVAAAVLALDQLTKWWAASSLDDGHVVHVFGSLRFNLVHNSGSAFSIGRGLGPVLGVFAVFVVLLLVRMGRVLRSVPTAAALGAILGGAVGNLSDRLLRSGGGSFLGGYVVDFVDLQWWPVFNVADAAIVCGVLGLAWCSMRGDAGSFGGDGTRGEAS